MFRFWSRFRLWFRLLFRFLPLWLLGCRLGLRLGLSLWLRLGLRRRGRRGRWLSLGLGLRLRLLPRLLLLPRWLLPGLVLSSAVPRGFMLRWGRGRRRWPLVRRRSILRRGLVPRRPVPSTWLLVVSATLALFVLLLSRGLVLVAAQEESCEANTAHQRHPEKGPHSVRAAEQGDHHWGGEIRHDDDGHGANHACNEAVPLRLQRRQVEESRTC